VPSWGRREEKDMSSRFREQALFEEVPLAVARGVIGGAWVRVVLFEQSLFICPWASEELVRVEPGRRREGGMELIYTLRNPQALAGRLDCLLGVRKESLRGRKTSEIRRVAREGVPG
jgi:hypothetical protein